MDTNNEGPREQMERVSKTRKENKNKSYYDSSKKRLLAIAEKKIKTTFIGSIDVLEKSSFGKLFGFGKRPEELTEQEREWRAVWDEVRIDILNNGNNQRRALANEINEYEISWNRYNLQSVIKNEEKNGRT